MSWRAISVAENALALSYRMMGLQIPANERAATVTAGPKSDALWLMEADVKSVAPRPHGNMKVGIVPSRSGFVGRK